MVFNTEIIIICDVHTEYVQSNIEEISISSYFSLLMLLPVKKTQISSTCLSGNYNYFCSCLFAGGDKDVDYQRTKVSERITADVKPPFVTILFLCNVFTHDIKTLFLKD